METTFKPPPTAITKHLLPTATSGLHPRPDLKLHTSHRRGALCHAITRCYHWPMPRYELETIIERYLIPSVAAECQRLGMPVGFVRGIYAIWPKLLAYDSMCEPTEENGEINGVRIRIDYSITNPNAARRHFWHEMRHAKDILERRRPSEIRANLYSWQRYLEFAILRRR